MKTFWNYLSTACVVSLVLMSFFQCYVLQIRGDRIHILESRHDLLESRHDLLESRHDLLENLMVLPNKYDINDSLGNIIYRLNIHK